MHVFTYVCIIETLFILDIFVIFYSKFSHIFIKWIWFARVFTTVKVFFTTNTFGVCWHVLCHFHCHVNLPWDSLSYACDNVLHYSGQTCGIHSIHFYIQSFSLTECIGIVGVRKYLGCPCFCVCVCVCLCVCVCVCLSVCLSVCHEPFAETTRPITTKLTQMGSLIF